MDLRKLRFVTLLLASLAMGMKLAHALEFGPKLAWDPALYLTVQTSLYAVFAVVGPVFEVGAFAGVVALTLRLRGQAAFAPTRVSLICIAMSLALFGAAVLPANMHIQAWAASGVVPDDWMRWRLQWQLAQTTSFVLHAVSLSALLVSVLRESPKDAA